MGVLGLLQPVSLEKGSLKNHTCRPCPGVGAAVVEGLQVRKRRAPFVWEDRCCVLESGRRLLL